MTVAASSGSTKPLFEGQHNGAAHDSTSSSSSLLPMSLPEYKRYGRQMILPQFGLNGQLKLRSAKVLVVGAGGLGCPSIQYLAAAGVGCISILDHDTVEVSNLARQILHTDERIGMNKARSAAVAAQIINPHIRLNPIEEALSVHNAVRLIGQHDVVLDCTDNVLTRYLISDAAVRCGRPVVSGAAQGVDGQLVTLNKALKPGTALPRGPCYRCLFPKAPRPQDVTDCEDGGVLGTITGLVGTLQAIETIKLLADLDDGEGDEERVPCMTLVSPLCYPPFRTVRLRPRRIASCRACGDPQRMTADNARNMIADDLQDENYIAFCGLDDTKALHGFSEVSASELHSVLEERRSSSLPPPVIVDVRPPIEFDIAHLPDTINSPFRHIDADPSKRYNDIVQAATVAARQRKSNERTKENIYVVCRRGNDSRLACHALAAASAAVAVVNEEGEQQLPSPLAFVNVRGGLRAWSKDVDDQFPIY